MCLSLDSSILAATRHGANAHHTHLKAGRQRIVLYGKLDVVARSQQLHDRLLVGGLRHIGTVHLQDAVTHAQLTGEGRNSAGNDLQNKKTNIEPLIKAVPSLPSACLYTYVRYKYSRLVCPERGAGMVGATDNTEAQRTLIFRQDNLLYMRGGMCAFVAERAHMFVCVCVRERERCAFMIAKSCTGGRRKREQTERATFS